MNKQASPKKTTPKPLSKLENQLSVILRFKKSLKSLILSNDIWPYLEATLTVLLVLFFVVFAIKPTVLAITSLLGEIKSRQILNEKMTVKINSLVSAQNSYFSAEEKLSLLDEYYPEKFEVAQGASQLFGVALDNKILVESFSANDLTFPDLTSEKGLIDFNFSGSGGYEDVMSFINDLYSSRRAIFIDSYSLSPIKAEDGVDPNIIVVNLKGKIGVWVAPVSGEKQK
jgi:hypothetical protein